MTNNNKQITRTLNKNNDKVIDVVEKYQINRYEGKILSGYHVSYICEDIIQNIKDTNKITILVNRDYNCLHNFDIDTENYEDGISLEEYQSILDNKFGKGKYIAKVLVVLDHSTQTFYIQNTAKGPDRWDSYPIGLIGVLSDNDPSGIADDLTSAWNGYVYELQVYDNLDEDIIDLITITDFNQGKEWIQEQKEKYGIDFDNLEITTGEN